MARRQAKLNPFKDAQWRWENNIGFIFLPHLYERIRLFTLEDVNAFTAFCDLLETVNRPSRLQRLWYKIKPPVKVQLGTTAFDLAISQYRAADKKKTAASVIEALMVSKGHIVKKTQPAVYDPNKRRTGGRVVKAMPRQLKKMKDAQSAPEES